MMLFKLSAVNMKKSMKDYAIYFMTLILGVALFYMFNSLDAQESIMVMDTSTYDAVKLLVEILGGVSVFISFVLAFLMVYANNFLMKRRKREFGIYMTLGMGKGQISRILMGETFLVGLISLAVGLLAGIFGSQFMSVLVAEMFEADMSAYAFVFSVSAFWKTILYFGLMYLAVMAINTVMISRYPLIRLIHGDKRGEKVKLKNPVVSAVLFAAAAGLLGFAYYQVGREEVINDLDQFMKMIGIGAAGTFLFFWSLSGLLLRAVRSVKSVYLRRLTPFVMRQVNSQVNTMTVSMTIICLMLFLTICIFSASLAINESNRTELRQLVPTDLCIEKFYTQEAPLSLEETMEQDGFELSALSPGWQEVFLYTLSELSIRDVLGDVYERHASDLIMSLAGERKMDAMTVSDYNILAQAYGKETLALENDTYQIVADYQLMVPLYEESMGQGVKITLNGRDLSPSSSRCVNGFVEMSSGQNNGGVLIVPDGVLDGISWESGEATVKGLTAVNYAGETGEEKTASEAAFFQNRVASQTTFGCSQHGVVTLERRELYAASIGVGAVVIFVGMYLGIVFLICSAALLALKVLSESSDNKARYGILRKIGADEKMITWALFEQAAIYFLLPLLLASVHSIFGLKVAEYFLNAMGRGQMVASIVMTAGILILIYGGYFLITFAGSRRIIRET